MNLLNEPNINRHFYRAYEESQELNLEYLNFEDFGFSNGYPEIEENLERFGITELTVSETSTGLMEILTALKKMGFKPVDLIQIDLGKKNWQTGEAEKKSAILLKKI